MDRHNSDTLEERCGTFAALQIRIIANDAGLRRYLRDVLEFTGCQQVGDCEFSHWQELCSADQAIDLVLMGVSPAEPVLDTLMELNKTRRQTPVFLVYPDAASRLLDPSFEPYIFGQVFLPLQISQLLIILQRTAISMTQLQANRSRFLELVHNFVGKSQQIQQIRRAVEQVANSEATVLILGETGTGKEVVARNLHNFSSRRNKLFVPVNCGAIPPDLLESELFGHEKGAFTGAISARKGRFELAEGGTLFLDEIGDMSLPMQVKLLRVLQERSFERLGSNKTIAANLRVIAATHRDLEQQIAAGQFREDLYYRLNVFPIEVPPLRQRQDDIPLLIQELITRLEQSGRGTVRMTPQCIKVLCRYSWAGNVRELANLIERLVILYPFRVCDVADLPERFRPDIPITQLPQLPACSMPESTMLVSNISGPRLPVAGLDLKSHLAEQEQQLIDQALQQTDGVVAHAARLLNMRRTTLVEKMRKYGHYRSVDRQESDSNQAINA